MIAVLTDLRRPAYLRATLDAAMLAGAADLHRVVVADFHRVVVADFHRVVAADVIGAEALLRGWPAVYAPKPASAWQTENRWTTWAAFDLALAAGEDLIFLEDDVLPCARAVEYVAGFRVPEDCAWTSFFAPWGDGAMPYGVWRAPARNFTFCQALKIPFRTLRVLCAARPEMEALRAGGSDTCLAILGAARGWHYGVHYPHLFQHVGVESSVTGPGAVERVSRAWPGPDFDAMELRRCWVRAFE